MEGELAPQATQDTVCCIVDFFESLWRAGARVHIPETIIYKFGRLDQWYFNPGRPSDSDDGPHPNPRVKRKRPFTLHRQDVHEYILNRFTSPDMGEGEVVATYTAGEPGSSCSVIYLTRATLEPFLRNVPNKGHGLLQRWVAPFGGHATMLRTDWSPHYFGLDMRVNWHAVADSRQPLSHRLATFDGGVRHVTATSSVNRHLWDQVGWLNCSIAESLDSVLKPAEKVRISTLNLPRALSQKTKP